MNSLENFSSKILPNAISGVGGRLVDKIINKINFLISRNKELEISPEVVELKNMSDLIKKIAQQKKVTEADWYKILECKSLFCEFEPYELKIFPKILLNILNSLKEYFEENSELNLQKSFVGLYDEHLPAFKSGGISVQCLVSLSADLVGEIKNNEIIKTYKLSYKNQKFLIEKSGCLEEILAESNHCFSGKSGEEVQSLLKLAYTTPGFITTLQKHFLSTSKGGSFLALSVRGQGYFLKKMLTSNYSNLEKIKDIITSFSPKDKSIFWESFSLLTDSKESEDEFLDIMDDGKVRHWDGESGLEGVNQFRNLLLDKFVEIFALIDDQKNILAEHVSSEFLDKFNPLEYNYALKQRMKNLVKLVAKTKNKEDVIKILESEKFEEEILVQGTLFRAIISDFDGDAEKIESILEHAKIETIQAGNLIVDKFDMDNPHNYKYPDKFGINDYQMIVRNMKAVYLPDNEKYLEVLLLNFANDLTSNKMNLTLFRIKGELKGICKTKSVSDQEAVYGTMYVEPEFQGAFKVGSFLQNLALSNLDKNITKIKATCSIGTTNIERHKKNGWIIDGYKKELATQKNGETVESDEVYDLTFNRF